MAQDIFQINNKDLKKLIKFSKKAPREFGKAAGGVINTLAFENREINISQIKKTMTVRNERFVTSSIRVEKAKGYDINKMVAIEGSIMRPRFTGWAEQELNIKTRRKRLQTIESRGGSFEKRVRPKAKMKRANKIYTYKDFQTNRTKDKTQSTIYMINSIRKGRVKRNPFIIERNLRGRMRRYKYGLYAFSKRRITRLQNLDPKNPQPKRNKWMTKSLQKLDKTVDLQRTWEKSITIVLNKAYL